jgi:hypothetical protein
MNQDYLAIIQSKLRDVFVRENKRNALKGLYSLTTTFCGLVFAFGFLENIFEFSTTIRAILFFLLIGINILLLCRFIIFPLLKNYSHFARPDYLQISKKVGNSFPEINDELLNTLQLIDKNQQWSSSQLIDAAFERIYNKIKDYNFTSIVDFISTKKYLRIAFFSLIMLTVLEITVPSLSYASFRLINFAKSFSPPQKFILQITPGNAEITKDENITIKIKAVGETPSEIIFSTKSEEQSEFIDKILLPDSLGEFRYQATAVKNSFEYYASAEMVKSNVYKITVINRPVITNFVLTIIPPTYSKLPEQIQNDNGSITALRGSLIKLSLNSSRELSKAIIQFSDSSSKPMKTISSKASVEFFATKNIDYQILITDSQNNFNINQITYSIKTLPDSPPTIEILSPNSNIKLNHENKVSIVSKITDDYGFSKMFLNYRLSTSKYRQLNNEFTKIPLTISPKLKEDEIYFVWDLAPLVLAEGERLSYYLEVFDNDNINGPKSSKSQQFAITVPSLDELFNEVENKQQETVKNLTETLKDAEKLNQEFKKISNDLKQNSKEISWQEKERIEKASDKFKEINKKIDDISQKLSETKNELAKNNMLSEETMNKYNELQKLIDKIGSDELKEIFKRMQEALKGLSRDNAQMSLDEMKANEEYIKKSIERTLNLLKRIQAEQKVDELIKRTENLTQKIDELKNKTDKSNFSDKSTRDELSKRQKDITEDVKNLKDEMNSLEKMMSSLQDMPNDLMDKSQKEFDGQKNQEVSKNAEQNLQQQQKSVAMQNQTRLSQNMKSMGKQFQSMQSSMQQMNQMKSFYDLMKILNNLISLSKDQEKLKNETEQLSPYSQDFSKYSREQNEIQDNLGKVMQSISALSQKTFMITPEMGNALGKALSQMQQSISMMQFKNGPATSQKQKEAMASINEAASLVKSGMDKMMSGGQGEGMMNLMQQLQGLSQQQMNLNRLTQMLNQGQMSQEMAAQMQRLSQQQEMIRKSLEQLNQEAKESGQSKRIASNLEKILNEMKEVVTNLQSQKVNNDLIKQQERILSKLLDAQTSMNERDYEKDRKSESGKNYDRNSPPDLILNTEEGKNKLKDELMKAIKEGYKKDYEELIRKYFEALEKTKREK